MTVYTEATGKELTEKLHYNVCSICGGPVNAFWDIATKSTFIACSQWPVSHHQGIEREAYQTRMKGKWIEEMENKLGEKNALALRQYQGVTTLSEADARKIVTTLWPDAENASPQEVFKAITLCSQYGLNPLAKHLYLIPFWNKEKKRFDYVCVQGIATPRLIASRKHKWSFLDDTPRIASDAEIKKHYGKVNPDKLYAIAIIKDIASGATMTAWGEWNLFKMKDGVKVPREPQGQDKDNSPENMVCIHAERKALDMMYPEDMPAGSLPMAGDVDDNYIDGEAHIVEEKPEVKEPEAKMQASEAIEDTTKAGPEEYPETMGELFNYCISHGRQFTGLWMAKQLGYTSAEQIKDIKDAYLTARQLQPNWEPYKKGGSS